MESVFRLSGMTCRAFPSEQFSLDGIQKPQTGKMNTFNTFLHAFLSDVLELNIVSHSGETPDSDVAATALAVNLTVQTCSEKPDVQTAQRLIQVLFCESKNLFLFLSIIWYCRVAPFHFSTSSLVISIQFSAASSSRVNAVHCLAAEWYPL